MSSPKKLFTIGMPRNEVLPNGTIKSKAARVLLFHLKIFEQISKSPTETNNKTQGTIATGKSRRFKSIFGMVISTNAGKET